MKTRPLEVPELDFNVVPTATNTMSTRLREKYGITVSVHPRIKKSKAYWLATGYNLNDLTGSDGTEATRQIPYEKTAFFCGAGVLAAGDNDPAHFPSANVANTWGQANCDRNGDWIGTNRPYMNITNSVSEEADDRRIYSGDHPDLFYMWHLAVAKKVRERGGRWFDDYAGTCFVYLNTPAQIGHVRSAMLDKPTALAKLQQGGALSYRNTPAWQADQPNKPCLLRWMDVLIQQYWVYAPSDLQPLREIVKFICNCIIANNGLDQLNLNPRPRVMAFGWDSSTQPAFDTFAIRRVRTLANGGTVETDRFPAYPFAHTLALRIFALTHHCTDLYSWEDNNWYSDDPNRVPVDSGTPGNLYTHYSGPTITQYNTQILNYDSPTESNYPGQSYANDDALMIAANWGESMFDWGGQNFVPYPVRLKGESAWSATTMDAALTAWEQERIYCQATTKQAGRWSMVLYNFGTVARQVEVQLANGIWKSEEQNENGVALAPGIPYCFIIDANA